MGRTGQVTGGMKAQDGSRETHVPVERPLRPRRPCKSCCKLGRGEFSAVVVLFVSKSKSRERGEQSAMHVAVGVLSFRNQQHKSRGRGHHESDGASRTWMDGEGACDAMRPEEAAAVLVRAPGVWRSDGGRGRGGRRKAQSSSGTPTTLFCGSSKASGRVCVVG